VLLLGMRLRSKSNSNGCLKCPGCFALWLIIKSLCSMNPTIHLASQLAKVLCCLKIQSLQDKVMDKQLD
jgi:hypothetical protein